MLCDGKIENYVVAYKNMSIVYAYTKKEQLKAIVNGLEVVPEVFNIKWKYFRVISCNFTVKFNEDLIDYKLESPGLYAIYNKELLQVNPNPSRLLLVSDLDKTIFHTTPEGLDAYSRFIHFWIKHYEFNGSKLVYNTGRSLKEYSKDIDKLYEPDLLISTIANYVYKFDQQGNGVLQESFHLFVEDFADADWDSKLLNQILLEKFPCLQGYLKAVDPYDIFFLAPKDIVNEISKDFIEFVKNNDNVVVNGRCFKGKTIISNQGSTDNIYLEVLPKFGGKGLGVKYAQWLLGFVESETVVAGDSLNDKDALKCMVQGVIVRNAEELLMKWYNKRERPNVYLSNLKYADAIIDFIINKCQAEEHSIIFIFSTAQHLAINSTQQKLSRFKEKWSVFTTNSLNLTIGDLEPITFTLQQHGRYAIYNCTLINISKNLNSVLLVTDLDHTIFDPSPEGLRSYSNFIEFWITHFEFNGSFLVYNTGRHYEQFAQDAYRLFLGDLHQLSLGNYAYILNKNLELVPDRGFKILKYSEETHEWDSQLFFDSVKEKFELQNDSLKLLLEAYFLLEIPNQVLDEKFVEIKQFIKNKEKNEINGKVFQGKARIMANKTQDSKHLEIIPVYLGKNVGVQYAQKKFSFANENTIAAGHSMNDKDALKLPVNGIVMCNSEEILID